jgi:hypothetical protein
LLLAAGFGIAAFLAQDSTQRAQAPEIVTEANEKLRQFPLHVRGAEKVIKHEVPQAKYCLVNIKQRHYASPERLEHALMNEGVTGRQEIREKMLESYAKVNRVQKDIYMILEQLGAKYVLAEGALYTKEFEPFTKEEAGEFYEQVRDEMQQGLGIGGKRARMAYLANLIQQEADSEELPLKELRDEYARLAEDEERYRYIPGACVLMAAQEKIILVPPESHDLNARAWQARTHEELDAVQNERENHVMKLASELDCLLPVMVYGKQHDFKDNIEKWNRENPDLKFSLIEIMPQSMQQ